MGLVLVRLWNMRERSGLQLDVAEAFPTEEAVNEALRGILSTARAVRRVGSLSDHALQPAAPKRSFRRK